METEAKKTRPIYRFKTRALFYFFGERNETEVARGIPFQDRRLDLEVRAAELLNIANN